MDGGSRAQLGPTVVNNFKRFTFVNIRIQRTSVLSAKAACRLQMQTKEELKEQFSLGKGHSAAGGGLIIDTDLPESPVTLGSSFS